jgi:hypothetical protein
MSQQIQPSPHHDFELLGQKFNLPSSGTKLAGLSIILACILGILIFLISNKYSVAKTSDGWIFKGGVVSDKMINLKKGFVIGFWTPCDNTKYGLSKDPKDTAEYNWQARPEKYPGLTIDSVNIIFGKTIKNYFGFNGYRRYKVFGEGASGLKEGWWWNIGFEGNCDDEFLKEFKTEYIKYWHPNAIGQEWDKLYVEVTGNSKN